MTILLEQKRLLMRSLEDGIAITSAQAELFPDLLFDTDGYTTPEWILPAIRRPGKLGSPRYVMANGKPYHVSFNGSGPLVLQVSFFDSASCRKIIHDPYKIDNIEIACALDSYRMVEEFISDPKSLLWKFTSQPRDTSTTIQDVKNKLSQLKIPR